MHWAQFLHLYQPYYQEPDVLERIVGQSYRPIIEGLYTRPGARITLNVSGVLLDLFDKYGYTDLIEKLRAMGERGQIEFVGSARYHALLPFLPDAEVTRQLDLNTKVLRKYLGHTVKLRGVFLPEMAYAPRLAPLLEAADFEYVLLDELAMDGHVGDVDYTSRYQIEGTKLGVFFRQRRMSTAIMNGSVRTADEVVQAAGPDLGEGRYLITGMDGEIFGHWHAGHDRLLFEMLDDTRIGYCQVGDLMKLDLSLKLVAPVACSWADSEKDLASGQAFYSWCDPHNDIQKTEWELQELVLRQFDRIPESDPGWKGLRTRLDPALASDIFFWSSGRPWWSIELIEDGAHGLASILFDAPIEDEPKAQARELYHRIMDMAFDWRRSGKLREIGRARAEILRIPFRDRTDGPVYKAFLTLLQEQENQAVGREDYEAAVLWRDARHKLETRRDVFDSYHVIDMLRVEVPNAKVEEMIQKYRTQYHHIKGGQPEQRSN